MKKLAIVIDSFSGLYKKDIEMQDENIYFLSLQVEVDGEIMEEGLEIPKESLIDKIRNGAPSATSLPSLAYMQELIERLTSEYEQVIFLPILKYISGTSDTLAAFAKDHKNATIINNNFVGATYLEVAKKAMEMSNKGDNFEEIVSYIKTISDKSIGYIIPNELKALIKSGRLTGIKKHIITTGNLSLIIKVFDKLSVNGLSRTKKGAVAKVIAKLEKFCSENKVKEGYVYKIVFGYEETLLKLAKEKIKENALELGFEMKTSLSTFVHTGWGSIYIGVTPKIS
ncbi:MAG: DegV family protein [Metamycoplasmataceae bacterium]